MSNSSRAPWISALLAYFIWGAFPLFWRLLHDVPSIEIVAQRSLWSAVFLAGIIAYYRRESLGAEIAAGWAERKILIPAALLIGTNWLVYVWAVTHGHVLEASLGYFICPFIQMLLGKFFHGEKLIGTQSAAIGISLFGVAWIALSDGLGHFPWVATILATSFAVYGSIKKPTAGCPGIPPVRGAFFEALVLAVPAFAFISTEIGTFTTPVFYGRPDFWMLSAIGGVLPAPPLILSSSAAKHPPLSALGFLRFLNPTIQFALAIWVFGESFSGAKGIGFAFIWIGAGIYLGSQYRRAKVLKGLSTTTRLPAAA